MSEPLVTDLEIRMRALEARLGRQRALLVTVVFLLAGMMTAAFRQQVPSVIRARGIVIEDSAGRERILIGAPIPAARNRVRTDSSRVASVYAPRFPASARFMEGYKAYRSSMHGIVILDEGGFDRIALGDSTPDLWFGKRIAAGTGLQINDEMGTEWTGYSLMTVQGKKRVVLGLDARGQEAVTLSSFEDGRAGLNVYGPGRRTLFVGKALPNDPIAGLPDTLTGMVMKDGATVRQVMNMGKP